MLFRRLKKPTDRLIPRRPSQRYRYVRLRWHLFFAIFDLVGGTAFGVARLLGRGVRIWRGGRSPSARHDSDPVRSILLIQLDHMGDAILSTGMIHVLRETYPDARLDILVGPWNRTLFEEAVDDMDRVLVFERGGRLARLGRVAKLGWPIDLLRYGSKLRRERYDLGFDVRGEMPHALLMWIAGIRRRVGWAAGGGGFLLTDSACWVPDRPEIENRQAMLEAIGIRPKPSAMRPRLLLVSSDTCRPVKNAGTNCQSSSESAADGDTYIAIHLTAGTRAKEWPAENWARLISKLIETSPSPSPKIILVGSPADHIIGERVEKLVSDSCRVASPARVESRIGRLSLVELAGVLARAKLMIGADSGPAHMAAAVGTPTVVLFSGTNRSEQWRPPGEHVTVLAHDVPCRPCHQKKTCPVEGHPCMTSITPEQVVEAVKKVTAKPYT